jgi:hypothetical protein
MLVKLNAAGAIQLSDAEHNGDGEGCIERRAMLVYAGEFESGHGPVTVKPEHLVLLVATHNSALGRVKRLVSGAVDLKHCQPVQLDHSASARDTVGRLVGDLEIGDHELDDGQKVPAVFGRLRILGKDNVERVQDGRWTHLSLGADFELGKIVECTITPFPAAADASMLSRLSKEKDMLTRLKAFLTGFKKMSDTDADAHLAKLAAEDLALLTAEETEHTAKLAKETADAATAASDAKLTAARANLTQLSAGFTGLIAGARLAARQGSILTQLSRLRAAAKVTPAEIKKLDISKLAAEPQAAIDLVMKTYAAREPQVLMGQVGSTVGVEKARIDRQAKKARMTALESASRKNMSSVNQEPKEGEEKKKPFGGAGANDKPEPKDGDELGGTEGEAARPTGADRPDVMVQGQEDSAYLEHEYNELTKMMSLGDWQQASTRLKAFMTKCMSLAGAGPEFNETNGEETEKQLSALTDHMTKMEASFIEVTKLAGSLAGVV